MAYGKGLESGVNMMCTRYVADERYRDVSYRCDMCRDTVRVLNRDSQTPCSLMTLNTGAPEP